MLHNFTDPEDLLSDESFLSWYYKTGDDQGSGWEHWMSADPGHRVLVQQAVNLLQTIQFRESDLPTGQLQAAESALMSKIRPVSVQAASSIKTMPVYRDRRWIAAASILILLAGGMMITRYLRPGRPEVKTEYGQISHRELPDGTEVTMNANSLLTWSSGWKDGADREVWVNGEAFFHVRKTPMKSRFIVHTDHFDIIVTGTQFNVMNRPGRDNILLHEGSVLLFTRNGKELNMAPGDFVEFNGDRLEKRPALHDSLLAWKEQKLIFERTPLRELVTIINDQYGVAVRLASDSIGERKISAILPNNNLDVLLKALEATMDFDVVRQDGSITIRAHKE